MSWDEMTSWSKEISLVALSIVELCLAEGINQLVSKSDCRNFYFITTRWKGLRFI